MIKKYPYLFFNTVKNVSVKIIITGERTWTMLKKGGDSQEKTLCFRPQKLKNF